jgi:hypothetical protein
MNQSSAQLNQSRDAQHDFDFNLGTWKTHISRLQNPLTGSATWVEYELGDDIHPIKASVA